MAICWSHARKAIWKKQSVQEFATPTSTGNPQGTKYHRQSTQSNLNLKFDVLWLVAPIQLILLITKIQQKTRLGRLVVTSPNFCIVKMDQKTEAIFRKNWWPSQELNATADCWAKFNPGGLGFARKKIPTNSGLAGISIRIQVGLEVAKLPKNPCWIEKLESLFEKSSIVSFGVEKLKY